MGFGDSLRKWATSKATEVLASEVQKRTGGSAGADTAPASAAPQAPQAPTTPGQDPGEVLLRAAFPKLGQWADQQEAAQRARAQETDEAERARIAALPLASVQLTTAGDWGGGQWSGQLHLSWVDVPPETPNPEYPSSDPYATRPRVSLDLYPVEGPRPSLGGHELVHWGFELPGYTGDATYDLTAIARERVPAALTYEEWGMEFADSDDASFYFFEDAGQSTVTVSEDGKKLAVTIALSGALGALTATATITR